VGGPMTKSAYALQGEAQNALWAHIPLPDGAETSCYWSPMTDDPEGRWWRDLYWWEGVDSETTVCLGGNQFSDGTSEREITVHFDNNACGPLKSSTAARELAARLIEAADRLDEIGGWVTR
jgi:hypothetical protein